MQPSHAQRTDLQKDWRRCRCVTLHTPARPPSDREMVPEIGGQDGLWSPRLVGIGAGVHFDSSACTNAEPKIKSGVFVAESGTRL